MSAVLLSPDAAVLPAITNDALDNGISSDFLGLDTWEQGQIQTEAQKVLDSRGEAHRRGEFSVSLVAKIEITELHVFGEYLLALVDTAAQRINGEDCVSNLWRPTMMFINHYLPGDYILPHFDTPDEASAESAQDFVLLEDYPSRLLPDDFDEQKCTFMRQLELTRGPQALEALYHLGSTKKFSFFPSQHYPTIEMSHPENCTTIPMHTDQMTLMRVNTTALDEYPVAHSVPVIQAESESFTILLTSNS